MAASSRYAFWRTGAKWLLVTVVTFGVMEGIVRVFERVQGVEPYEIPHIFTPNPAGSMRLLPNLDVPVKVEGQAFRIRTNSRGLAWRETEVAKPSHTHRWAFMGDSFTQGMWSPHPDSSFVGIAEQFAPADTHEFVNFGVGGYGMKDVRLYLEEEVLGYEPDVLVLVFFCGNDYSGTYDGLLEAADVTPPKTWTTQLYQFSALARLGVGIWNAMTYERPKGPELLQEQPNFDRYSELNLVKYPFNAQNTAEVEATLAELSEIREICDFHHIDFRIVNLPFHQQVYVEPMAGKGWRLGYPQSFLEAWCEEQSIPYMDLLPGLRHAARTRMEPLYFEEEQHLTPEGHEEAGKLIGNWLFGDLD